MVKQPFHSGGCSHIVARSANRHVRARAQDAVDLRWQLLFQPWVLKDWTSTLSRPSGSSWKPVRSCLKEKA